MSLAVSRFDLPAFLRSTTTRSLAARSSWGEVLGRVHAAGSTRHDATEDPGGEDGRGGTGDAARDPGAHHGGGIDAELGGRVRRLEAVLSVVTRYDPRGVVVRDEHGAIVELNPAAAEMLHLDLSTVDPHDSAMDLLHGHVVDGSGRRFSGSLPTDVARDTGDIVHETVFGIGPESSRRWLGVSAVPVDAVDGRWVVSLIRDITSETVVRSRLEREVAADPLTGIGNRRQLEWAFDELDHCEEQVSVCVLDLDDFKPINDDHGHSVGDEVLRIVAQRLARATRPGDAVVRLGGDEFVAVLRHVDDDEVVSGILERMSRSLAAPVPTSVGPLRVTASIGCATGPGGQARRLLRRADAEMYRRKRALRTGDADIR